jgi:iron(III) transport system substrate-binding protein
VGALLVVVTLLAVAVVAGSAAARTEGSTAKAATPAPKVTVTMTDTSYKLAPASVPSGTIAFTLVNKGKKPHVFGIAGKRSAQVAPGKRLVWRLTVNKVGSYKVIGTKKATLRVTEKLASLAALVAAAKREGTLTWYTAIPLATSQPVADAFEKEYGVNVDVFNTSSGPMADRYAAERGADTVNADVINLADPLFFNDGVEKGWFLRVTKANVPALATWPTNAIRLNTYAMIGAQPIGIAYNRNLVNPPPTSWEDLLDPRFKDRILMTDPTLVPAWMATYKLWQDKLAPNFLQRLNSQSPAFISSSNPGAQQVAAGEKWVNFPTSATALVALQSQGAPLGFVVPSPTTGVEMLMAISTASKHPNAALLFFNYALSPAAQELFNRGVGDSALSNIPGVLKRPATYFSPDIAGAQRQRAQLLSPFGRS